MAACLKEAITQPFDELTSFVKTLKNAYNYQATLREQTGIKTLKVA